MTIDQKIIDRFQQMIDFEAELMKTRKEGGGDHMYNPPYDFVDKEKAHQWAISCLHIIKRAFGESSDHYTKFNAGFSKLIRSDNYYVVKQLLGILKAAKDDFENGYLFDTRVLIQAEIFDDFLEQAQHLYEHGYYAPAAVIAGSVLEDGLRKLCARKSIPLPSKPKMDSMNAELAKAGAYNLLVQKKVTALADLRNKAAHGEWTKFTTTDVEQMIGQIRSFMGDHFS